ASRRQRAPANLSPSPALRRPAKRSEISVCSARSTFTQKRPLRLIAWQAGLAWWTQTSRAGRSAETEDIALTVTPARPPGPSVVTTFTVAAARLMPSRKLSRSIVPAPFVLLLLHHAVRQPGGLLHELQRLRPVEASVDRVQMRERRRLREQLEG